MESINQTGSTSNVVPARPAPTRTLPVAVDWVPDGVKRFVLLCDADDESGRMLDVVELARAFGCVDGSFAKAEFLWRDGETHDRLRAEAVEGDLVGSNGWRVSLRLAGRLVGREITPELLHALGVTAPAPIGAGPAQATLSAAARAAAVVIDGSADWIDQYNSPLHKRKHLDLCRKGVLPHVKHGKQLFVRRAAIDAYLLANAKPTKASANDVVDRDLAELGLGESK